MKRTAGNTGGKKNIIMLIMLNVFVCVYVFIRSSLALYTVIYRHVGCVWDYGAMRSIPCFFVS